MKYGRLKPYVWPQDKVKIPNGQGLMPRTDYQNTTVTKSEGYWYTGAFDLAAGASRITELVIPTEADGDFWCNNISVFAFDTTVGGSFAPNYKMNIIDVRTGYDLTFPFVRMGLFKAFAPLGIPAGQEPFPIGSLGYRSTSTLIQPYCFTRNGGIRLIVDTDGVLGNRVISHVSFIGWKEYQYASR